MKSIFLLIFIFISCLPKIGLDEDEMKFERKIWITTDKQGGNREMMLHDLKTNYLKIRMEMDSVEYLLGKPDSIEDGNFYYLVSYGFDPCYFKLIFNGTNLQGWKKECN